MTSFVRYFMELLGCIFFCILKKCINYRIFGGRKLSLNASKFNKLLFNYLKIPDCFIGWGSSFVKNWILNAENFS